MSKPRRKPRGKRPVLQAAEPVAGKQPKSPDPLVRLLESTVRKSRQQLESDEPMADRELDDVLKALDELEPKRQLCEEPSFAVTPEGSLIAYGERYDQGIDLWNNRDAFRLRLQGRLSDHMAVMEFDVMNQDGEIRRMEAAVHHIPGSRNIEIIGLAPLPPREQCRPGGTP